MGAHYLELAGYATAAIDDLAVVGANEWTFGANGDYDSAILRTADDRMLIARCPNSAAAAGEQAAISRSLASLTPGLRSRLPFTIPTELGRLDGADGQLAVYEFIPGTTCDRVRLEHDSMLVADIGRAVAAIHSLPRQYVESAGLPVQSANDSRDAVEQLMAKARDTGRLPAALDDRWGGAVDDVSLWSFVPSVIHGSLERGSFLTNGAGVVGVLGWGDLRIGDPARDMSWLHALDGAVTRAVFDEYVESRGATVDRQLRQRSTLYAELELARWLVHGVETGNDAIIADAEQLLDSLVNRVRALEQTELRHETLPVLDLVEVQELLADAGSKNRHPEQRLLRPEDAEHPSGELQPGEDFEGADGYEAEELDEESTFESDDELHAEVNAEQEAGSRSDHDLGIDPALRPPRA
ncbi:phosphotransferase [Gulosibacter molinativorax]|uniref:Macrolide 2'-phosphotransferase n=1 Tax=Gulosibacter molinativorax TaxID=256821 RepID=A0ABT7C5U0_9MICO|nr:phosphotransferase [Gulosibacter molinativorax]MDJ1370583.1 macrolide 2'-phosphotransferase [Gulosibacter molinativorax]QUY62001.1 Macrolide 2'-phosphotransferase [Gulosibacter molinativorax]